jgi:predicted acyl esterase
VLAAAAAWLAAAGALAEKTTHMVPVRDGTRLATDVYRPEGDGPFPVILTRTPYSKDKGGRGPAVAALLRGYAFVIQDMRGRFDSEGRDAVVFHNDGWAGEHRDGHDTLKWIIAQPWCDGNIASWGGSALGITQNMQAPGAPDQLKAQYVAVAFSNMYTQAAYQGGVLRKALVENWLRQNDFSPENLETVLAHPRYDELWAEINPEAQASRVNAPGIFYGGWYDIFVQGTINSFLTIQSEGGPRARGNCRLVVGPWAHGKFDKLEYPPNSKRPPQAAEVFRFFDHHLKGKTNGTADDLPVHYYVMGDPEDPDAPGNTWRSVETWPPPAEPTPVYFHADGRLALEKPDAEGAKLTYRYDPKNPVPTIGGQNLTIPKGPMDQRPVETRPDVLVFTTGTLDEPVEVTGRIFAKLYVASDCPDTDFTVKLTDVYPDGRSMLLTDGILRARYRESFTEEKLLEPGEVAELTVDLWSTSIVFNRGHKIRVAVSSSNDPRFDPNPNTGGPLRADDETRVATNTLYVSRQHPSHIILPRYKGEQ